MITLGPDSAVSSALGEELTRQSEQPFQLYNLEIRKEKETNKNEQKKKKQKTPQHIICAHVSPCSAWLYISLHVKIPSNSRTAPVTRTPLF